MRCWYYAAGTVSGLIRGSGSGGRKDDGDDGGGG